MTFIIGAAVAFGMAVVLTFYSLLARNNAEPARWWRHPSLWMVIVPVAMYATGCPHAQVYLFGVCGGGMAYFAVKLRRWSIVSTD